MKINGEPVIDARVPLDLEILPKDIKEGSTKDPTCCAAAIAAIRQVKGSTNARVHLGRIYLRVAVPKSKGKHFMWLRFRTPDSLRGEIIAFDRGGQFMPGVHKLRLPYPTLNQTHKTSLTGTHPQRKKHGKCFQVENVRTGGPHRI